MTAGRTASQIHRDGRIFITDYRRGLVLLDPETGSVTPFLETALSEGFKGVNDLVFSADGDVYFTDQGQTGLQDPTGRVYRYSAAGVLARLIDTVPSPNGIALSADGKVLFVAATRANQIWRLPLHPSGVTTKASIFAHLHGGPSGPDGLALDEEGCLLIVHASFGSVWRLSPFAEPLDRIVSCAGRSTTNLAFGGPDGKSLFITEAETGSILRAELPVPGQLSVLPPRLSAAAGLRAWPRYCSVRADDLTEQSTLMAVKKARPTRGQGRSDGGPRARGPHRVQEGRRTLSLAELSSRTGLVKSTIMRLAVSLEKHGLMARVADSSYRLDAEVFRLGMLYRQSFRLENFVRPVLEELVARSVRPRPSMCAAVTSGSACSAWNPRTCCGCMSARRHAAHGFLGHGSGPAGLRHAACRPTP